MCRCGDIMSRRADIRSADIRMREMGWSTLLASSGQCCCLQDPQWAKPGIVTDIGGMNDTFICYPIYVHTHFTASAAIILISSLNSKLLLAVQISSRGG